MSMRVGQACIGIVAGGALILVSCAALAERPETVKAQIAGHIASYQPIWTPPAKQLQGRVVLIDPEGGNAPTADERRQDDLSLWTASHLYHLVRLAGGTPVLTRADDREAAEVRRERLDMRVQIRADAQIGRLLMERREQGIDVRLPVKDALVVENVPAHRRWAEQIYHQLVEASAGPAATKPSAGQPTLVPFHPKPVPESAFAKAAKAIWPEGRLPVARAEWFCNLFARQTFSDRTNLYFEPQITLQGETVMIGGATSETVLLGTLARALHSAGITDVRADMRLLPEQGRLQPDAWFGACIAPMALTFGKPTEGGPLQTQLLYGEPVYLLDRESGFYLVQGGDGYCGWVRENCIRTMPRAEFTAYVCSTQAVLLEDIEHAGRRVVRGSRLMVTEASDAQLTIRLPEGEATTIARTRVRMEEDRGTGLARASAGLRLLETPYLFAGRSSVGLDCSGMVGTVCDEYGTVLPRDAAQQFVTGRRVATRWFRDALKPGDRFYFLNETGKIFHTGLSLGDRHFVHSSPPAVQISSLRPGDRLYGEHWDRQFVGAKRP